MMRLVPAAVAAVVWMSVSANAGLRIESLGRLDVGLSNTDETQGTDAKWAGVQEKLGADAGRVVIRQVGGNTGGNTSVRNSWPKTWKDKGYYRRSRDLGQVFTPERDFVLDAIVLRTGNDTLAFLEGSAGTEVFVQFFEVVGTPVIDDNGTPPGTDATHGFSKNHRCDDFVRGVEYKPLRVVRGGRLPDLTKDGSRFVYMKWDLTGRRDELRCEKGKRYAFMVGFVEPGPDRNFTLANRNNAADPAPPRMNGPEDGYGGGWGLRREGDGEPPTTVPGAEPPADKNLDESLLKQACFPEGDGRYTISPTCDGYPDVDTYRDLEFYLLARPRNDRQ